MKKLICAVALLLATVGAASADDSKNLFCNFANGYRVRDGELTSEGGKHVAFMHSVPGSLNYVATDAGYAGALFVISVGEGAGRSSVFMMENGVSRVLTERGTCVV